MFPLLKKAFLDSSLSALDQSVSDAFEVALETIKLLGATVVDPAVYAAMKEFGLDTLVLPSQGFTATIMVTGKLQCPRPFRGIDGPSAPLAIVGYLIVTDKSETR